MTEHGSAPLRLILVVAAFVLFAIAAVAWTPPAEPWRTRLIAAGLACWVASTFFG
jgi:hypothetical protein